MKKKQQTDAGKSYNIYRGVSSVLLPFLVIAIICFYAALSVLSQETDEILTVEPDEMEEAAPLMPAEGTAPLPGEEGTLPAPAAEGTIPMPALEATVPVPSEGTLPVSPAGLPMLPAAPLMPAEGTAPLPPSEGTTPLPPSEATVPLPPIEMTLPVIPDDQYLWTSIPQERKRIPVGMDKCMECHRAEHEQWGNTIHAKWIPSLTPPEKAIKTRIDCESCHGPGSLHIKDTKNRLFITAFGPLSKDTVTEQNNVCLKCHNKGSLYHWDSGIHGRMQGCTDCHTVMRDVSDRNLLSRKSERNVCFRCHPQKKTGISRSPHLPAEEAKMTCSTCHAPHGSDTEGSLTSGSVNENCYRCHADKRGPYLFDHLPVPENCLLCHNAHDSGNRSLLKVRQPFLCLECHTNLPAALPAGIKPHNVLDPHSKYTTNKGCINCHPMIHGSRHPSGARLQR